MAINLKSTADFWARIRRDTDGTSGDGTTSGSAASYEQFNPDIGQGSTTIAVDGDLRTIDTPAERLSLDPDANTAGAATVKYSTNFLIRWLTGLVQDLLARLPGALGQNTMANSLTVAIASNQSPVSVSATVGSPVGVRLSDGSVALSTLNSALITVSRNPVVSSGSYTRPADTTAYAVNDSLSNSTSAPAALTFSSAVLANSSGGRILRAIALTSQTTFAGSLRLHLYNGNSAPTATNDNAASPFSSTNWIGYIDFNGYTTDGTGSTSAYAEGVLSSVGALDFVAGATTSLFGLVVVKTAFTPASAQTFTFNLTIDQC